jgi:hypothetical protein
MCVRLIDLQLWSEVLEVIALLLMHLTNRLKSDEAAQLENNL